VTLAVDPLHAPAARRGKRAAKPDTARREVTYRHTRVTRLTHWINVVAFTVLLMTGLQIFNGHPALYWGQSGSEYETTNTFLSIGSETRGGQLVGVTRLGPLEFESTGVLGVSEHDGQTVQKGFPSWATIPSHRDLSSGRLWHFFFAWVLVINGLIYLGVGLLNRSFGRKMWPIREELRHIGHSVWEHARFKWPEGEEAKKYNVIQKLTYLIVLLGLFPMVILTGLTMSPGFNAVAPFLLDVFGGRQSARTLHFIVASLLVGFVLLHVGLVLVTGVWNNMRSMINGRYVIKHPAEGTPDAH
jgi:thiosulfate reductase cytochrome b subunit